jgi:hypothetical protein
MRRGSTVAVGHVADGAAQVFDCGERSRRRLSMAMISPSRIAIASKPSNVDDSAAAASTRRCMLLALVAAAHALAGTMAAAAAATTGTMALRHPTRAGLLRNVTETSGIMNEIITLPPLTALHHKRII